ncbi:hypothetical protein FNX48_015940 [Streptomyces sp. IF17]|nr:hypothetical protein [Streptomyces alkaliphilus]
MEPSRTRRPRAAGPGAHPAPRGRRARAPGAGSVPPRPIRPIRRSSRGVPCAHVHEPTVVALTGRKWVSLMEP